MKQSDLPEGATLITPKPFRTRHCTKCMGAVREDDTYVELRVQFDGDTEPLTRLMHVTCAEDAHLISEGGLVRGWACYCCSCPPDGPFSFTCRNHGADHDQDGCARHRQPAVVCDCGCNEVQS